MPSPNRVLCPLTPAPIPPINLASKSLNRNDFKIRQKRRDPYSTPVLFCYLLTMTIIFFYLLTMTIHFLFTFWQWGQTKCPTLFRCDVWWRSRWWRLDKTAGHSEQEKRRDDFLSILKRKEVYLSLSYWSCLDRESRSRHWQKVSLDSQKNLDNLNKNLDAD
jgi:hypothetical protein